MIYEWRLRLQGGSAGQLAPQARGELSEADVLKALRRENTRLLAENDILKKAAVILGTKPHLNGAK